jgi:SAM-dependent methyltransferase
MQHNSTTRFSDRVDNYIKYRPHYPPQILDYVKAQNVLSDDSVIADIGSGTGISTELFLKNVNTVYAVEPNKEMREAAERLLSGYKNFISVNGTAESTTLPNESIDLIIAGQAFHWFDIPNAITEFKRILKSGGNVVLMWNVKQLDSSPFMRDYEKMLLEYGTDYQEVKHENLGEDIFKKFYANGCDVKTFPNEQVFDLEGLKGRLLSSSYAPNEQSEDYKPMITVLETIFNKHNKNGKITFDYITQVYSGKL